jgi:sulfoxide reductase catalytic subunit YedY
VANILLPPSWRIPESQVAPESAWLNRRELVKALGLGVIGAAALTSGCATAIGGKSPLPKSYDWTFPPAQRNPRFPGGQPPAVEITSEEVAASYNNFYEFTTAKDKVWTLSDSLKVKPWTVEVSGECDKPTTFNFEELLALMPLEERVYRFRCVEAWSMVVPWTGFPLKALLDRVVPNSKAKYVRLVSLGDSKMMPGVASQPWYPWPYHEGLTLEEANHELTLMAVGIYGHALPNQHGAPIRLVTPWKYGYKQLKSIVKIELVAKEPKTFWNTVAGDEYDFWGNVRPDIPHKRWSQATDRVIPTGERVKTPMYNGYAEQIGDMYKKIYAGK